MTNIILTIDRTCRTEEKVKAVKFIHSATLAKQDEFNNLQYTLTMINPDKIKELNAMIKIFYPMITVR